MVLFIRHSNQIVEVEKALRAWIHITILTCLMYTFN